ncbi:MAG: cytochrome C [Geobacteraceae bacterium GWC2_58_44]|nr:MAG: cytochrome C [Geobacteraceae bacterium GWC2_58_44]HBG05291.1 cytochrome C [Geobacter sp.]
MRFTLLLAALPLILLTGCTTARQREPIAKSLRIDSPKLLRGEKAYMHYCDKCHPGGDTGLGFAIKNKPLPEFLVELQVRVGLGAMPAFSDELLPDDQLDDITEYIKLLRKQ